MVRRTDNQGLDSCRHAKCQTGEEPLGTVGVAARRPGGWGTSYRRRFWRRGCRGRGHLAGDRGLGGWRVCIAGVLQSADVLAVHPERTAHHRARGLVPTGTLPRLGCRNGGRCVGGLGGLLSCCRLVGVGGLLPRCHLVDFGDLLPRCRLVGVGDLLPRCRLVGVGGAASSSGRRRLLLWFRPAPRECSAAVASR